MLKTRRKCTKRSSRNNLWNMSLACSSLCREPFWVQWTSSAMNGDWGTRLRNLVYILQCCCEWMPRIYFQMNLSAVTLNYCTRSSFNTHLAPRVSLKHIKINTRKLCICCFSFKNRNKQGEAECQSKPVVSSVLRNLFLQNILITFSNILLKVINIFT